MQTKTDKHAILNNERKETQPVAHITSIKEKETHLSEILYA